MVMKPAAIDSGLRRNDGKKVGIPVRGWDAVKKAGMTVKGWDAGKKAGIPVKGWDAG